MWHFVGTESPEVAMPFPARGLALGQGVARRGARGWARAQGPEDVSVGAPLPSTGQRGRSCSADAGRPRAGSGAPHRGGPRRPGVDSAQPGAASLHLGPRLPTPALSHPPASCPCRCSKLRPRRPGNPPPRPHLADLGSRALLKLTLVVASTRLGGVCVLQFLGAFISSPFIQKCRVHSNDQR